ncbi:MAG: dienelactone hydrolase family protein [Candidatus Tumulicola sp.]
MSSFEVDPTHAISPDFKRRAFVGIAAGAATGLSAAARGLPQTTATGKLHDPLVPENDPSIAIGHVVLNAGDATVPAYASWPAQSSPATPSVVVIMHIWGVDTSIRDVVRRFAKRGFAAIAPDLYARFGAPSGDGSTDAATFRPFAKRLDRQQYDGDIRAAAAWLKEKFPATKTGILGFCMGGHIALLAAIDSSQAFVAVCPFYGSLEGVSPDALAIPVCGSYGARDTSIPADGVRAFAAALRVPNDIRVYDDAGHAFFDDQRSAYVASAADDAWNRTLNFLETYAGKPSG